MASAQGVSDWRAFVNVVKHRLGANGWSRRVQVDGGDANFLLSADVSPEQPPTIRLRCAGSGRLYARDLDRATMLAHVMQEGAGIEPAVARSGDQQAATFAATFVGALVDDAPIVGAVVDDALLLELRYSIEGFEIMGTVTLPCVVPALNPHTLQLLACLQPTCTNGRVAADPATAAADTGAASAAAAALAAAAAPSPQQPQPQQPSQPRASPVAQQLQLEEGGGAGAGAGAGNGRGTAAAAAGAGKRKRHSPAGGRRGMTLAGKKRRGRATGFKFG